MPQRSSSASASPTRDRNFDRHPPRKSSPSRPLTGDSRSPSPSQPLPDRLRGRSPSPVQGRSRAARRPRSTSRSLSFSRSRSRSRSRSPSRHVSHPHGHQQRQSSHRPKQAGVRFGRHPSRSRSRSRSSSRSSSHSRSRSQLRRDYETARDKAHRQGKKEGAVKASAAFLGAVAVTSLAVHKFWPKGFVYGKEEWETRPVPKKVQKVKEDLMEKREEVRHKLDKAVDQRRPRLEHRHGRASSATSLGSSSGTSLPDHRGRERIYYQDIEARGYLPAAHPRQREQGALGPATLEPEVIWVDREGRRVDPPIRSHETVYRTDKIRYEARPDANVGPGRLVERSFEQLESRQLPTRSSKLMLTDGRDRDHGLPWKQDEPLNRTNDERLSQVSLKYGEPRDNNHGGRRDQAIALDKQSMYPEPSRSPTRGDRPRGRQRASPPSDDYELEDKRGLESPAPLEVFRERREVVRGRDSLAVLESRESGIELKQPVVETREVIYERGISPPPSSDYKRSKARDRPCKDVVVETKEIINTRRASPPDDAALDRDRPPRQKVVEEREIVRERGPSGPHRLDLDLDLEPDRDRDRARTSRTVRERREFVRDLSPSPRRAPARRVEEHEVVVKNRRPASPRRARDLPPEPLLDDGGYLDVPVRPRHRSLSPVPPARVVREDELRYY